MALRERVDAVIDVLRTNESTAVLTAKLNAEVSSADGDGEPSFAEREVVRGLLRFRAGMSPAAVGAIPVAHVRVDEALPDQLALKLSGVPEARARAALFVSIGFLASVFFIMTALLARGDEVIGSISGKFLFTFLGLLGAIILRGIAQRYAAEAERNFTDFRNGLEDRVTIHGLGHDMYALSQSVSGFSKEFVEQFKSFAVSVGELDRVVDAMGAMQAKLTTAVEGAATKIIEAATTAGNEVLAASAAATAQIDEAAGRLLKAGIDSSTALEAAVVTLNSKVREAGDAFGASVDGATSAFGKRVAESAETFGTAVDRSIAASSGALSTTFNNKATEISSTIARVSAQSANDIGEAYRTTVAESTGQLRDALRKVTEAASVLETGLSSVAEIARKDRVAITSIETISGVIQTLENLRTKYEPREKMVI
ncbi:hypothetical protein [Rhizobium leguminosarum]|uniref:hypothetical protein n=1 Tax=Rhizobium leguminosarum TaxID=384 RepID=UPI0012BD6949|nr:hypothetical protein [Rhizobium leguminosarum]